LFFTFFFIKAVDAHLELKEREKNHPAYPQQMNNSMSNSSSAEDLLLGDPSAYYGNEEDMIAKKPEDGVQEIGMFDEL
jgi:hypothetical protein